MRGIVMGILRGSTLGGGRGLVRNGWATKIVSHTTTAVKDPSVQIFVRSPYFEYEVVSLLTSPNGDSMGDTGLDDDPTPSGPLLFNGILSDNKNPSTNSLRDFLFAHIWSQRAGLNCRPAVYETAALPLSYVGDGTCSCYRGKPRSRHSHYEQLSRQEPSKSIGRKSVMIPSRAASAHCSSLNAAPAASLPGYSALNTGFPSSTNGSTNSHSSYS